MTVVIQDIPARFLALDRVTPSSVSGVASTSEPWSLKFSDDTLTNELPFTFEVVYTPPGLPESRITVDATLSSGCGQSSLNCEVAQCCNIFTSACDQCQLPFSCAGCGGYNGGAPPPGMSIPPDCDCSQPNGTYCWQPDGTYSSCQTYGNGCTRILNSSQIQQGTIITGCQKD